MKCLLGAVCDARAEVPVRAVCDAGGQTAWGMAAGPGLTCD